MKLRNKKTGEIVEYDKIGFRKGLSDGWKDFVPNAESIAELNEKWEDYKPKEPLIKDEEIRKFVRGWSEVFGVTKVYVTGIGDGKEYLELYDQDNGVVDGRIRISIKTQDGIWIGKEYTITELCGEKE